MGWFNKKENMKEKEEGPPKLPELPRLPSLPGMKQETQSRTLHQLPTFPSNSFGEKFSQDTIKEAVSGEREGDDGVFDADEFPLEEEEMMLKPQRERRKEISNEFENFPRRTKKAEPVFIRLDKFEESLHLFEKAKKQISEIEKMLRDIKKIKDEEEKELAFWEKEIQSVKQQIEKVDRDIFSKIE